MPSKTRLSGLEDCPLSRKAPFGVTSVSTSQFSIARHYGGIRFNGEDYTYFPDTDELVRDDVLKWQGKNKPKIKHMILKSKSDIPSDWKVLTAKKVSTVKIRPSNGVERFKVDWQDSELVSNPDSDIIIQSGGYEYPCKKDIFDQTYEQVAEGEYAKKETFQLVQIPEGVEVDIHTLEGVNKGAKFPDYVIIGKKDEVWGNSQEYVTKNLKFV